MTFNYDRIKEALPVESGNGHRSTIRARSDVVEVVLDCVLRRRQFKEIAQRCCVDLESLTRFRKRFITPEVEKIVLVEANKLDATSLDQEVNSAQDKIEGGIESILKEQRRLYRTLNDMVEGENLLDVLSPMMQLLRDQNKSYENLLKVYSNLREKNDHRAGPERASRRSKADGCPVGGVPRTPGGVRDLPSGGDRPADSARCRMILACSSARSTSG